MQAMIVGLIAVGIYSIGIAMGFWIGRGSKRDKDWDDMSNRIDDRKALNGKATHHEIRLDNQGQQPTPPKTPIPMPKKPKK